MTDQPLRDALRATLTGLKVQMPAWLIPGPLDGPTFTAEDDDDVSQEQWARRKATNQDHLHWMIDNALENVDVWPVDKTSRWIGFVQGVLAVKSQNFSVAAERDRTRPIFHEAYQAMGLIPPETRDR